MRVTRARLKCVNCGKVTRPREGIFDLLPAGKSPPAADLYASAFGWLYDRGVHNRRVAPIAGRLLWATDIRRMYDLMCEGLAPPGLSLDVPVGGGTSFSGSGAELAGQLLGIDLSWSMLRRAAARCAALGLSKRVLLCRGDATALPVRDSSVDRVLCFNGLHVISRHEAVLSEFRRVLLPGACLLGTTLVRDARPPAQLLLEVSRMTGFFAPPAAGELRRLARRCGFRRWDAEQVGAMLFFRAE